MSDHLSLSQLTDWVHGCLADDESAKVEQHLEACDKCAKLLDDVDSDTKFESRVRGILHSDSEDAVPEPTVCECPGSMIGPYKLLQLIGEGGMGAVWMAQQERPVQRTVALKIIKAGMDYEGSHRAIRNGASSSCDDGPPEYCQRARRWRN